MPITLINGRGQVGSILSRKISSFRDIEEEIFIYHTWNVDDKHKEPQQKEYEKFQLFVEENYDKKILFISTYSVKENWYNYYKQMAEAFLCLHGEKGISLRIPTIIGKGVLQRMKNNEVAPHGEMELITMDRVTDEIIKFFDYDGIIKLFRIDGERMAASTVASLLKDI